MNWIFALLLVLLALQTTLNFDIGASPIESLYGKQLRLPGEFWVKSETKDSQTDFGQELRRIMSDLRVSSPS